VIEKRGEHATGRPRVTARIRKASTSDWYYAQVYDYNALLVAERCGIRNPDRAARKAIRLKKQYEKAQKRLRQANG